MMTYEEVIKMHRWMTDKELCGFKFDGSPIGFHVYWEGKKPDYLEGYTTLGELKAYFNGLEDGALNEQFHGKLNFSKD